MRFVVNNCESSNSELVAALARALERKTAEKKAILTPSKPMTNHGHLQQRGI